MAPHPVHFAGAGTLVTPALSGLHSPPTWPLELDRHLDRLLLPERQVRVWLPPGYDETSETRYPVLYVHDGQHMMGESKTWHLGVTLSRLIAAAQISKPIVVLCDSTGSAGLDFPLGRIPMLRRRWLEYSDTPVIGERYLHFLADELKPAIDAEFKTLAQPEATLSMGSSMGGLCAFLSLWRRTDVFGNCACLSPVFQAPLVAEVALEGGRRLHRRDSGGRLLPPSRQPRIYIDNGGSTDEKKVPWLDPTEEWDPGFWWLDQLDTSLQPGVDAMRAALDFHKVKYDYVRAAGARHNERAWARRVDRPLRYLLPPERSAKLRTLAKYDSDEYSP